MKMTIETLTLENFKGVTTAREFHFGGHNAAVFGDNGTGKSTVYDGLTWLLFGKDSAGQVDFDIKPHDKDGEILDHANVTRVCGRFSVDGEPTELERLYSEKWSRKRGAASETFDGHVTEFRVNGVPYQKKEYDALVADWCDEDLFHTLTSVWFFGQMDWRKRRELLFKVCNVPDDGQILSSAERFAELAACAGNKTLEQYKKELTAEKKSLSGARDTLPARMDEVRKLVNAGQQYDFDFLRERQTELHRLISETQAQIARMDNGAQIVAARAEHRDIAARLTELEAENAQYRAKQAGPVEKDRRPELARMMEECKAKARTKQQALDSLARMRQEQEGTIAGYRELWTMADGREFTETTCPTCGQPLPPDKLEEARARFEKAKADRKAEIVSMAADAKNNLVSIDTRIAAMDDEITEITGRISSLEKEMAEYQPPEQRAINDMPDYEERRAKITADLDASSAALTVLETDGEKEQERLGNHLHALENQAASVAAQLAEETAFRRNLDRLEELMLNAETTTARLNDVMRLLDMIDDFTRYKVRFIEKSVNDKFSLCSFRLFKEQVNGGVADCCDVLVGGSRFGKGLNTGAMINAGLDIINVLSRAYDKHVPLFLDGAESVTSLIPVDTQMIRLCVSAADKELRVEVEL